MRTFRPTYRDGKGKIRKVKKWWIETRDHLDTVRRFAGFTDEEQTKELGKKIDKLVVCRMNNEPPGKDLSKWIQHLPKKLRTRLVEVGILAPSRATIGKTLSEHINDFQESLEARNRTKQYINTTINAVKRIAADCRFNYWMDISAEKVESYLKRLRDNGISHRRSNAYLVALKMFSYWMIDAGRASESPIRRLKPLNVEIDRRRKRRALTIDELHRLINVTESGHIQFGLTGYERSLIYRFAIQTGLRANEIRTLKVSSFDFKNRTVTVEAKNSKGRKISTLPLRKDMSIELQGYFTRMSKLPATQAFILPERTADMLKSDLRNAGLDYVDESGRYFDFHALRGETGTLLAAANVMPKAAQEILRHSDVNLTMNIYTHSLTGQNAQAVESLPDLSPSEPALKNLA